MSQKSSMKCLNTVWSSAQPISWKNWANRWMIHGNYSLDGGVSMWAAIASYSLIWGWGYFCWRGGVLSCHKLKYFYMTDRNWKLQEGEEDFHLYEEVVFCGWTLVLISSLLVCVASSTTASRKGRWQEVFISVLGGGVLWLALKVTSSLSVFVVARMEPRRRGCERRTLFLY